VAGRKAGLNLVLAPIPRGLKPAATPNGKSECGILPFRQAQGQNDSLDGQTSKRDGQQQIPFGDDSKKATATAKAKAGPSTSLRMTSKRATAKTNATATTDADSSASLRNDKQKAIDTQEQSAAE
jgi:hypothetical protein